MNISSEMNNKNEDLDLILFIKILWLKKFLIISVTLFSAIFSVFYALSIPNVYTSSSLLVPAGEQDSLSSKLGSLSGLAGLAGVSLPKSSDKTPEALSRINSYDFFINEFLPYINLEDLMAVKSWDYQSNQITYNNKLYDSGKSKWVRKVKSPRKPKPSKQEAYKIYKEIINTSQDPKTSFVNISISHQSPNIAKAWLDIIIKNINLHMKELDKILAENSINFLNETAINTSKSQIKVVISKLLEEQIQDLMLAEATDDYAFKPITSPIAPERKSKPSRPVICIFITMLGGLLSIIIAMCSHYYSIHFKRV
jgi:LPS O-antigen subunit length determinant protein (WzzB/FepE family)